jgi:hypothetical protein
MPPSAVVGRVAVLAVSARRLPAGDLLHFFYTAGWYCMV